MTDTITITMLQVPPTVWKLIAVYLVVKIVATTVTWLLAIKAFIKGPFG